MLERCRSDLSAALRSLSRFPSLVVGAVLTLAVSGGLNVAVFGLMDRALLSPPAQVAEPARVFALAFGTPGGDDAEGTMSSTSYVAFNALREGVPALSGAAAFQRVKATLMLDGDQRNVSAMLVSGNYFTLLGGLVVVQVAMSVILLVDSVRCD